MWVTSANYLLPVEIFYDPIVFVVLSRETRHCCLEIHAKVVPIKIAYKILMVLAGMASYAVVTVDFLTMKNIKFWIIRL